VKKTFARDAQFDQSNYFDLLVYYIPNRSRLSAA